STSCADARPTYQPSPTHPSPRSLHSLSLHDALPIFTRNTVRTYSSSNAEALMDHATLSLPTYPALYARVHRAVTSYRAQRDQERSEEHTSELQSRENLVCRLLLEKQKDSAAHADLCT